MIIGQPSKPLLVWRMILDRCVGLHRSSLGSTLPQLLFTMPSISQTQILLGCCTFIFAALAISKFEWKCTLIKFLGLILVALQICKRETMHKARRVVHKMHGLKEGPPLEQRIHQRLDKLWVVVPTLIVSY